MIEPLLYKNFIKLCSSWADVINRGESGIQIWPPIGGAHYRIKQFFADTDLQDRLFNQTKPRLLFIDANEITDYSYEDFEKQVMQELASPEHVSFNAYLAFSKQRLTVFFTGLDTAIKNGN